MAKRTREPDPDRLVRESAGSYRTEDGRFAVRSAGGSGRWYVTDLERHDPFGMDLVLGPFETLDEVRPSIVAQRDAPAGESGPLPEPPAEPAGRGKRRAEPEPEPEEPAGPQPASKADLARWRKRGDSRDEVAMVLASISKAWTSGRPGDMEDDLHPDAVFVQPGFGPRLEGRDAAIASFGAFMESARVRAYEEQQLVIDVVDDAAIATYRFRIDWEEQGTRHVDEGHDLFVFGRQKGRWRAVWRTLVVTDSKPAG
jgi:hypothetical protein